MRLFVTLGRSRPRYHEWDTTNDGEFDRTGERIELEKSPGHHPITLRVTDSENATATASEEVTRSFEAGNHTVGATAVDEYGAVGAATATVSVTEPPIEDQGPTVSTVAIFALVVCTLVLAMRRVR